MRERVFDICYVVFVYYVLTEAEYAFALKKKMIPLRMDEEYTPDGWLGILVRSKLYYTFYAVDQVDSNMKGLLKDIKSALRTADDDGDDDANETDGKMSVFLGPVSTPILSYILYG